MAFLKVLTYNIRHGRGIDNRVDLSRIAAVLSASAADIICLQEVDRGLPRSGMVHQAEALAEILDFQFAYHANFGIPIAGMGNAILSRFPIYSTWNTLLPFTGEPRGLLSALVEAPSGNTRVFCTHWGLDELQRGKQSLETARCICEAHRLSPEGIVVCGDLNAASHQPEVKNLVWQADLYDCGPVHALTYATDAPSAKIDYVLASANCQIRGAEVVHADASDHFPVLVTLEIAP